MSKYIYATVYEQFTGLKPPEPKSHKPRRRRGYGHPYRMRLNMQDTEDGQQESFEQEETSFAPVQEMKPEITSSLTHFKARKHSGYTSRMTPHSEVNYDSQPERKAISKEPKVTYKKRRHFDFSESAGSAGFQ